MIWESLEEIAHEHKLYASKLCTQGMTVVVAST